jgi:hypothetical protein
MAELSSEQKLHIIEYLKSIEKEKNDKRRGQLASWVGLFGISGAALITAIANLLTGAAENAARDQVGKLLDQDKVLARQTDALEKELDARAASKKMEFVAEQIESRTKPLLQDALTQLENVRSIKLQLDTAKGVLEAAESLKKEQDGIVKAISTDQQFLTSVAARVAFPSSFVGAFNTAEAGKIGPCPTGWTPLKEAAGRFIIGAGSNENADVNGSPLLDVQSFKEDPKNALGGEVEHKLTIEQLPPQSINISEAGASKVDKYNAGGSNYSVIRASTRELNIGGTGTSVSITPPFLALYYCIKD